jgi:hypothetical protein
MFYVAIAVIVGACAVSAYLEYFFIKNIIKAKIQK